MRVIFSILGYALTIFSALFLCAFAVDLASQGGRITPAEIAMETSLTANESQAILETLCEQGIAEVQITENGTIVYTFTGLVSESEKGTAQDPLER